MYIKDKYGEKFYQRSKEMLFVFLSGYCDLERIDRGSKMRNLVVVLVALVLMVGCSSQNDNKILTETIKDRATKDVGYLANLETFYGVDFTNKSQNRILADDFYIRVDNASVFYSYPVDKIEINDIDGVKTLNVSLPTPELISVNRTISDLKTRNKNYVPIDQNGERLDIENEVTKALNIALEKYEPKC